jgi:hypothetical protein
VPINFIPNDPLAVSFVPMRQISPRPNRPASKAGFTFFNAVAEGVSLPGTPEFLFWQCREAALLAIEVWEDLTGASLTQWSTEAVDGKKLQLMQNAGTIARAWRSSRTPRARTRRSPAPAPMSWRTRPATVSSIRSVRNSSTAS